MNSAIQCFVATVATVACAFALAPSTSHALFGQPGTLDATWATASPLGAGKAITPIGSASSIASAVAVLPDGNVLVVGRCQINFSGGRIDVCAVRYLPDGSLDTSWNTTGMVITPVGTVNSVVAAVALQPDGKALLTGSCSNGASLVFCTVRYLPDGTLDPTWNGTGIVLTPVGSASANARSIALQPDGNVLIG